MKEYQIIPDESLEEAEPVETISVWFDKKTDLGAKIRPRFLGGSGTWVDAATLEKVFGPEWRRKRLTRINFKTADDLGLFK